MPKALLVKEPKGELSLEEVEKVSPKAGEVLVENVAVAQNPVDYKQHEYGFWIPSFPHVLGCDVAGTVVEVGEGVTNFKQGDRIFSFTKLPAENKSTGAFQTHTIVTANLSGKIPENVSFEEASTFPLAFFTAVVGLYADLKLPEPGKNTSHKDEPVVIWGGASSVGLFAIQLARESGLKVIAIASKKNHELLKSLGASVTIDYKDTNVVDQIRNASNGKLKYIFDTICQSGSTKTAYEALGSDRGAIAITLADSAKQEDYPNADLHKTFVGNIYNFDGTRSDAADIGQRFWARLEQDLKNKTFVANPVRVVPKGLLGVSDGFKLHKEGGVSAEKLVYRVKETPGL